MSSPPDPPATVTFGNPTAERTVLLLPGSGDRLADPDPAVTARRNVTVLGFATVPASGQPTPWPAQPALDGPLPAVDDRVPHGSLGLIAVGDAAASGVLLAHRLADRVDRLVLISAPVPGVGPERERLEELLGTLTTRTLLINGQRDPAAANAEASWHRQRLPRARIEMIPASRLPHGRLELRIVWARALAHVAPGTAADP
ncbi:hypothetical protein [Ruania zhangjianzhongii]|uniref:hypothetical protein n=1 Tax=Ruania zhangjianzhongii TaxID=2603206 RepID=UPI0011C9C824|nr:hypothetical protein [Ruania zhangjianzhongii]